MNMNDYKKESKITLYAFGISFLFSFGLGLIVGNPFVIAFVRAFIAAFLFGVVFFLTLYIIKKYIPQLLEVTSTDHVEEVTGREKTEVGESMTGETGEVGVKVDYTVGDTGGIKKEEDSEKVIDTGVKEKAFESAEVADEDLKIEGKADKIGSEARDKKGVLPGNDSSTGESIESEEEEELPPIEELLNEEEEVVPDIRTEDEELGKVKTTNSDYISIGNIKIPNEPEMLAKAIKKVLKEDESG